MVSSQWGTQSGNVRIFRLEKIIQNNPKWKRNVIFPALLKLFMLYTIIHVRGKQAFQHLIESMYYSFVCTARVWGWLCTRQVKALTYFLPLPSATRGTRNEEDLSLRLNNIRKEPKEWRGKGLSSVSNQPIPTPSPLHPFSQRLGRWDLAILYFI